LQFLHIERASLIESIPEMPTSLRKLTILGCHPLLLERCLKDMGPDWPKIANIDTDLRAFSRGNLFLSHFYITLLWVNMIINKVDSMKRK
jgi:hypothetical protein